MVGLERPFHRHTQVLGLRDGERILVRSEIGHMEATARSGPCRRRHLQAFWPEANVLLARAYDPVSGEPDYNAVVTVEKYDKKLAATLRSAAPASQAHA